MISMLRSVVARVFVSKPGKTDNAFPSILYQKHKNHNMVLTGTIGSILPFVKDVLAYIPIKRLYISATARELFFTIQTIHTAKTGL